MKDQERAEEAVRKINLAYKQVILAALDSVQECVVDNTEVINDISYVRSKNLQQNIRNVRAYVVEHLNKVL